MISANQALAFSCMVRTFVIASPPQPMPLIPEPLFDELLLRAAAWAQQQEEMILRSSSALALPPLAQEAAAGY